MTTARIDFEKVKTSEYKTIGRLPIFDQGSDNIAGYTDNPKAEYKGKSPAILFGDHTLKLKIAKPPFAIGADGIQILEPDENLFDRKFFYYAIKGLKVKSYGYERHMKYLRELEVACPTIADQKRIADVLSAFDDKIELNNKISRTLEQIAQAIFKEWLLKNQKSNLKNKKLETICDIVYGKDLPTRDLKKVGFPVYGGNGVIGYSEKYLYSESQIIVGCRGAYSGNIFKTEPKSFVTHNSLVLRIKEGQGIGINYLFHALQKSNVKSSITGSAQPQITIAELNKIEIPILDKQSMGEFEAVVGTIEDHKYHIIKENQKLAALRDLLLPKLMSGEIRV